MEPEFDVFLAHHTGDKTLVREICKRLKQQGLKPWIDEEQIPPGRSIQETIQQAIPKVKAAAIIIGSGGIGRWQAWEIQAFFSQFVNTKNAFPIPVLLPGVAEIPEDLPFLQQVRWINFRNPEETDALKLLIWGITGKRPEETLSDRPSLVTNIETLQPSSFDANTYFNQAFTQYELKNYQEAIVSYSQAIKLKPDYADAYFNRGLAKDNLGDYHEAIADYNQAIKLKPDDASAYYNRGLIKDDLGDYHEAIADYNQAIKLKPDHASAYFNRGLAKDNLGYEEAINDYQRAAELYQKQGKVEDYQDALAQVKKLQKFWL